MGPKVQIKGVREGLLVTLGDGAWPEVQLELLSHIETQAEFLRGAKLILDVGGHELNAATLSKVRDLISDEGISLWAVLSNSEVTRQTAQMLGLATRIHQAPATQVVRSAESSLPAKGGEAVLVKRTLRSGNSVEHPGHVTVVGDVNPGAEIKAGGSVVVWGRLRGMVHAGCDGDEEAVVCALDLSPTQLRIADKIAIPPEKNDESRPEIALVRDGQVVAEVWNL